MIDTFSNSSAARIAMFQIFGDKMNMDGILTYTKNVILHLNAIIQMRLNYEGEKIYKSFFTVFEILKNRGLLYIGNRDLCHGNILALSNIGYYLQEHNYESLFYEKMAMVTYTDKNRYTFTKENNQENPVHPFLVQQYHQAKDKKVLFTDFQPKNLLRDVETHYIIVI